MVERKLIRVEADDPRRCQSNVWNGQCPFQAADGTDRCPMHNAGNVQKERKESLRAYQLGKWQAQVDRHADNDQVKSLRGEIGIARMTLETIISRCHDANDLVIYSGKLGEMVSKIERLVVSCNRIEQHLGMTLDRTKIMAIAARIVEIVSTHVEDPELFSDEIINAIMEVTNVMD